MKNSQKTEIEAQKEADQKFIKSLWDYYNTPEGALVIDDFIRVAGGIQARLEAALSDEEHKAFLFIRRRVTQGKKTSVRELAKHLGYKSSRTGARIMQALRVKGLLDSRPS